MSKSHEVSSSASSSRLSNRSSPFGDVSSGASSSRLSNRSSPFEEITQHSQAEPLDAVEEAEFTSPDTDQIENTSMPATMSSTEDTGNVELVAEEHENELELEDHTQDENTDVTTYVLPPDMEGEDEVFEGVLAPDEESPPQFLQSAVEATNVRVVQPRSSSEGPKRKRWIPAAVILITAVLAAVIIPIGVIRSRRRDSPEAAIDSMPSSAPSLSPTQAPTSARFAEVSTLIESLYGSILDDTSSPQYKAAQWMANVDSALDFSTVEPERFQQRYALVVFYYATGGPDTWFDQALFLTPELHECDWLQDARPGAYSTLGYVGVARCTSERRVESIEFSQNNLTGTLPEELGSLSSLIHLLVVDGKLQGTLPTVLFESLDLGVLDMAFNNFTGSIPTEIGLSTNMLYIRLQDTSLSGSIGARQVIIPYLNHCKILPTRGKRRRKRASQIVCTE